MYAREGLVGRVGVEPTVPLGAGFTDRSVCRFATYPYYSLFILTNAITMIPQHPPRMAPQKNANIFFLLVFYVRAIPIGIARGRE